MKKIVLAVGVVALVTIAFAQGMQSLLNPPIKQTLTLSELTDEYKAYRIKLIGEKETEPPRPGGENQYYAPPQPLGEQFTDIQWSKGETTEVDGDTFLAVYNMGLEPAPGVPGTAEEMAKRIQFRLELIRRSQIASISFREGITAKFVREQFGSAWNNARKAAISTQSLTNLKQIGVATAIYASDYDDFLPNAETTKAAQQLLLPYLRNEQLFTPPYKDGSEYLYNVRLSGKPTTSIDSPSSTPLWYESRPHGEPPMRHVSMVDTSTRKLDENIFLKMAKDHRLVAVTR